MLHAIIIHVAKFGSLELCASILKCVNNIRKTVVYKTNSIHKSCQNEYARMHVYRGSRSLQNLIAIPRDITDQCSLQKQVVKETMAKMATQSRD